MTATLLNLAPLTVSLIASLVWAKFIEIKESRS